MEGGQEGREEKRKRISCTAFLRTVHPKGKGWFQYTSPLNTYVYVYIREVKTFSTKTSRDVGMVPSVSKEHMCLH